LAAAARQIASKLRSYAFGRSGSAACRVALDRAAAEAAVRG